MAIQKDGRLAWMLWRLSLPHAADMCLMPDQQIHQKSIFQVLRTYELNLELQSNCLLALLANK